MLPSHCKIKTDLHCVYAYGRTQAIKLCICAYITEPHILVKLHSQNVCRPHSKRSSVCVCAQRQTGCRRYRWVGGSNLKHFLYFCKLLSPSCESIPHLAGATLSIGLTLQTTVLRRRYFISIHASTRNSTLYAPCQQQRGFVRKFLI